VTAWSATSGAHLLVVGTWSIAHDADAPRVVVELFGQISKADAEGVHEEGARPLAFAH
jgi:hypothetical protein